MNCKHFKDDKTFIKERNGGYICELCNKTSNDYGKMFESYQSLSEYDEVLHKEQEEQLRISRESVMLTVRKAFHIEILTSYIDKHYIGNGNIELTNLLKIINGDIPEVIDKYLIENIGQTEYTDYENTSDVVNDLRTKLMNIRKNEDFVSEFEKRLFDAVFSEHVNIA